MFIVQLAGVDDESIANDYALTRIGREPIRETIMNRLAMEPLFASNNEAALNMFTCRCVQMTHIYIRPLKDLFRRRETMMAFLQLMQEKYDGVEAYCRQYLGLSDDDIQIIQSNILVSAA